MVHYNLYGDGAPSNAMLFIQIFIKINKFVFDHSEPRHWNIRLTDICELVTQFRGKKKSFRNPNKAVKLMACESQIRKCPNLQWLSPFQLLPTVFSIHGNRNDIIFKICAGLYFSHVSLPLVNSHCHEEEGSILCVQI
jgi:hypothetical protein